MWDQLLLGLIFGWGAAIPIGPINLEIIRRNLRFGFSSGLAFGLGACSADLTYFFLLLFGAFIFLKQPIMMRTIGFIGSAILIWFGISALRLRVTITDDNMGSVIKKRTIYDYFQGYALTLLNPITIIFWASISSQIVLLHNAVRVSPVYSGLGILVGTLSWVLVLNLSIHIIRHRLSPKTMHYLNSVGGIIVLGMGIFGLWHTIFSS